MLPWMPIQLVQKGGREEDFPTEYKTRQELHRRMNTAFSKDEFLIHYENCASARMLMEDCILKEISRSVPNTMFRTWRSSTSDQFMLLTLACFQFLSRQPFLLDSAVDLLEAYSTLKSGKILLPLVTRNPSYVSTRSALSV